MKKVQDPINESLFSIYHSSKGLSLIEVLVALSLAALLFLSVDVVTNSNRENLDSSLDTIERAIRFSSSEAILRGSIIRVHLLLDKSPQEMVVETGPQGDFVLPSFEQFEDEKKLSLSDQEKRDALVRTVNKQFHRITEFQEKNYVFPSSVKVHGVSTQVQNSIVQDGDAAIYIFPSGEKDASLLVLSTPEEMVALSIDPFTDEIHREYKKMESANAKDEDLLINEQDETMQSFYQKWKTE